MTRRVRENAVYLFNCQSKINRDVLFIKTRFPIFNDVVGRHTSAFEYGAATLYAGL